MRYSSYFNPLNVPQSAPLPGREAEMVANDAGGYVFKIDKWTGLTRFLVLGSEGGTYYVGERKHTMRAGGMVEACIKEDPTRVFATVERMLKERLIARRDPAILVLAMLAKADSRWARPGVELLKTGTDLLHYAAAINDLRGWGPAIRKAFATWYLGRDVDSLAYQLLKYQSRDGWSHRDVLRLAHVKPLNDAQNECFKWAVGKGVNLPGIIGVYVAAQVLDPTKPEERARLCDLIRETNLTREMIPTKALTYPDIWETLLERMPMMAMVRNLANMSKVGLLTPFSAAETTIAVRLEQASAESSLHPLHYFLAGRTYASGSNRHAEFTPSKRVVVALERAFVASFKGVKPCGRKILVAIDTSGSMQSCMVPNTLVSTAEAAAAMALILVKTEPLVHVIAFDTEIHEINLSACSSVNDVRHETRRFGGGTDLALPFAYVLRNSLPADGIVTYTDTETWAGRAHAAPLFKKCQGVNAMRAVNVAMSATSYSQLDQADPDVLEVAGFDASVPQLVAQFVAHEW